MHKVCSFHFCSNLFTHSVWSIEPFVRSTCRNGQFCAHRKKFCTEMQPKGIWCKIRQSSICETKTGQEYKTVEPVEAQFSCFAQIIQGITNLPHIVAHLSESVKTGSNAYKVASCRKDQGCTPAAPTFFALYCHAIVLTHWFKSDTEKGMFFFWAEIKAKSKVPSWFWSNEESLRKKREAKEKRGERKGATALAALF